MAKIEITDMRDGVTRRQIVDLEDLSFTAFIGGAVANAAMLGDIVRTSFEYILETPTYTITGLKKKADGNSGGIRWIRTYTLLED